MKQLGTESAFAVLAQAQALERTGRRVVHLEIGEPDFPTPAHIVEAAQAGLKAGHTHYVPAPGTLRLREAVSAYLERNGRLRASPDRVLVTPGAKPIMFFTMLALCEEGDEVIVPRSRVPDVPVDRRFRGRRPRAGAPPGGKRLPDGPRRGRAPRHAADEAAHPQLAAQPVR